MGRGFCQRINFEERFGKIVRGVVYSYGKCEDVAKILDISPGTLSSRFKKPGKMRLEELKALMKLGKIQEEDLINYLYEKQ